MGSRLAQLTKGGALLLCCTLLVGAKCQPVQSVSNALQNSIANLSSVLDSQRQGLKTDVQELLSTTMTDLSVLSAQVSATLGNAQEGASADLGNTVSDVIAAADALAAQLREGTSESIAQATKELQRTVAAASASAQRLVLELRPVLAQAAVEGDKLVVRVADESAVLIVRVVAGLLALVAVIGLVVLLARRSRAGAIVTGAVLLVGCGVLLAAGPIVRLLNPRKMTFPNPDATCKVMSEQGAELEALLSSAAKVLDIATAPVSPAERLAVGTVAPVRWHLAKEVLGVARLPAPAPAAPGASTAPSAPATRALTATPLPAGTTATPTVMPVAVVPVPVRVTPELSQRIISLQPTEARIDLVRTEQLVARLSAPLPAPDVTRLVLGGASRGLLATASTFQATGVYAPRAAGGGAAAAAAKDDAYAKELAAKVRDAAISCETWSPSPALATESKHYLVLANSYLGLPVVCQTDAQCNRPDRCDAGGTAECLPLGVFCERPDHCELGTECDTTLRRCVPRDGFRCSAGAAACRPNEGCQAETRTCRTSSELEGRPCEDLTRHGPCAPGRWHLASGAWQCVQTYQKLPELCDGTDNDCDGTVDDGPGDAAKPCATGMAGLCAQGTSACRGGRLACDAAQTARTEMCNNEDDDCDAVIDEWGVCGPVRESFATYDNGGDVFGFSESKTYGSACRGGQVRSTCRVTRTGGNGHCEFVRWNGSDPHDCSCTAHFGGAGGVWPWPPESVNCAIEVQSVKEPRAWAAHP